MCSADTSPVITASQVFRPGDGPKIVLLSFIGILRLYSVTGQSMKNKHNSAKEMKCWTWLEKDRLSRHDVSISWQ